VVVVVVVVVEWDLCVFLCVCVGEFFFFPSANLLDFVDLLLTCLLYFGRTPQEERESLVLFQEFAVWCCGF